MIFSYVPACVTRPHDPPPLLLLKRDCPDGKLSKNKFIDIYKQFYKKGQVDKFCEHAFRVFDEDGSGYIGRC